MYQSMNKVYESELDARWGNFFKLLDAPTIYGVSVTGYASDFVWNNGILLNVSSKRGLTSIVNDNKGLALHIAHNTKRVGLVFGSYFKPASNGFGAILGGIIFAAKDKDGFAGATIYEVTMNHCAKCDGYGLYFLEDHNKSRAEGRYITLCGHDMSNYLEVDAFDTIKGFWLEAKDSITLIEE